MILLGRLIFGFLFYFVFLVLSATTTVYKLKKNTDPLDWYSLCQKTSESEYL